ncbi:uncharacterized protein LOC121322505 [Polyodon spathula]|uniref:uncharacterized protein LOC121322505 n=1 Tax=Polyodon spathula TaxID=7913 RepID=UPI001B7E0C7A|nr:uncharacterized protein LOC121322505 [Polyodon spathula]XP_041118538.1 uncharacterized protein LOC121322505 [Polyodon spathula]
MSQRYKVILRADSINRVKTSCENSTDYVGFLLEQERKCGPDGFLDSKRYRNPYLVRERLVEKLQTNSGASLSKSQQKADLSFQREYDQKEHERGIQCIEKLVCRAAEIEHKLSNRVHRSEYEWKKQKNQVEDLQAQLHRLRVQNSDQIQRGMVEAHRKEEKLLWLLNKEKSELHKYHSKKENSYWKLINHRALQNEDKHILTEMQKERRRLLKINERTNARLRQS